LINPKGADNASSLGLAWKARFGDRRDAASATKENLMSGQEERGGHPTLEKIDVRVELVRHGLPVETVTVGFEGLVNRPELAQKIAAVLELEAEEILTELSKPECLHPEHHHGRLELVCIDLHFETDSAKHHFFSTAKWERVHRWGCKKFKIATDACANLELHSGSPEGPALNESKSIGKHEGCTQVWLVKPGPEKNG
jgi:hypothetical protein